MPEHSCRLNIFQCRIDRRDHRSQPQYLHRSENIVGQKQRSRIGAIGNNLR
jgi:hypothetical protein